MLPKELKAVFQTAYEVDPTVLIADAVDREPFNDQPQSIDLYREQMSVDQLVSALFSP